MKWWLFPKQVDPEQDKFSDFSVFIIFISVIGICTFFRAITWPANKHVDIEFAVQAIIMPLALLVTLLELFLLVLNGFRHYAETRLLIAATQEYKLQTYARRHLILAGWSALTPLEEPALNMLRLEGEFPLVPKTPLKIPLADEFDYTRNEQFFCRLLEPMVDKLNHPGYRHVAPHMIPAGVALHFWHCIRLILPVGFVLLNAMFERLRSHVNHPPRPTR